jgi:hypothetical protein
MQCPTCTHEMSAAEEAAYRAHMSAVGSRPRPNAQARPRCEKCGALIKPGAPCRRCQRSGAFTLLEVVLSMVVVAIGIMAVVTLIPIGTAASRDAVAASHAADAGEWIANHLARDYAWAMALPLAPPATTAMSTAPAGDAAWVAVVGYPNLYRHATQAGRLRYYAARHRGAINSDVRCWRQLRTMTWPDGTTMTSYAVIVELSWPATMAPRDRQRAAFVAVVREP